MDRYTIFSLANLTCEVLLFEDDKGLYAREIHMDVMGLGYRWNDAISDLRRKICWQETYVSMIDNARPYLILPAPKSVHERYLAARRHNRLFKEGHSIGTDK